MESLPDDPVPEEPVPGAGDVPSGQTLVELFGS